MCPDPQYIEQIQKLNDYNCANNTGGELRLCPDPEDIERIQKCDDYKCVNSTGGELAAVDFA